MEKAERKCYNCVGVEWVIQRRVADLYVVSV